MKSINNQFKLTLFTPKMAMAIATFLLLVQVPLVQADFFTEKRLQYPNTPYNAIFSSMEESIQSKNEVESTVTELLSEGYHPLAVMFYADQKGMEHDDFFSIVETMSVDDFSLKKAYETDGLKAFMRGGVCASVVKNTASSPADNSSTESTNKNYLPYSASEIPGGLSEGSLPLESIASEFFTNDKILMDKENLNSAITVTVAQLMPMLTRAGLTNFSQNTVTDDVNYEVSMGVWYNVSQVNFSQVNDKNTDISTQPPLHILMHEGSQERPNRVMFSENQRRLIERYLNESPASIPVAFFFEDDSSAPAQDFFAGKNLKIADQIKVVNNKRQQENKRLITVPDSLNNQGQILIDYAFINNNVEALPDVNSLTAGEFAKAKARVDKGSSVQMLVVNGKIYISDLTALAVQQAQGMPAPTASISYKEFTIDSSKASTECKQAFDSFQALADYQSSIINDDLIDLNGVLSDEIQNAGDLIPPSANRANISSPGGVGEPNTSNPNVAPPNVIPPNVIPPVVSPGARNDISN